MPTSLILVGIDGFYHPAIVLIDNGFPHHILMGIDAVDNGCPHHILMGIDGFYHSDLICTIEQ